MHTQNTCSQTNYSQIQKTQEEGCLRVQMWCEIAPLHSIEMYGGVLCGASWLTSRSWRSRVHASITRRKSERLVLIFWHCQTLLHRASNTLWIELWVKQRETEQQRVRGKSKKRGEIGGRWGIIHTSLACFDTELCPWACRQRRVSW